MILKIDEDHPVVVGCLLEWLYEKKYAHMSICSTYEPPLGPCMAGLHVAMYEIAIRHNIFELKTYAILMIHRTLSAAEGEGNGEEEVISLIRPIYNLYLPKGDRLVEFLLQRIREMRGDMSMVQTRTIRELEDSIPAFGSDMQMAVHAAYQRGMHDLFRHH